MDDTTGSQLPPEPSDPTLPEPAAPDIPPRPEVAEPTAGTTEMPGARAAAEPKGRRTTRLTLLLAGFAGLLLIAGGAIAGVLLVLRGTGDVLIDNVPSDSYLYATAYLDPSADQKLNLLNMLDRFPELEDQNIGKNFVNGLDGELEGWGINFDDDVKPWLGTQVGSVVLGTDGDPGFAVLVSVTDPGAAEEAMGKVEGGDDFSGLEWKTEEHAGVQIHSATPTYEGFAGSVNPSLVYAVSDDVLILSDSVDATMAVLDAPDDNLGTDTNYTTTTAGLPKDRLATVYLNFPALVGLLKDQGLEDALASSGQGSSLDALEAYRGMAMSVSAEDEGLDMRIVANMDSSVVGQASESHRSAVLSWTPEDAYLFFTASGLDQGMGETLDQIGQLDPAVGDQMDELGVADAAEGLAGDFGVVVNPQGDAGTPAGAVLMAVDDPAAVQVFFDKLGTLIEDGLASQPPSLTGDPTDFGVQPLSFHQDPFNPTAPTWDTETYEGVEISSLTVPDLALQGIIPAYAVTDDMAMIASSPDEIKALIDTSKGSNITDNDVYQAAIRHGDESNTGMMFLNLAGVIDAAAEADPYSGDEMRTQLEPLKALIMTAQEDGDMSTVDLFLLVT